jgi:electron-transferring-flavoprotein dehydrogenase
MTQKLQRDIIETDVTIVGAGPAGLAAAIRLKQAAPDLSVTVIEKAAELGAHVLSGAVFDPVGLDALLPAWRTITDHPLHTPVRNDRFFWLTGGSAFRMPHRLMPPIMSNEGNFIVSLGSLCKWLGSIAENLGVDIYTGFAGADLIVEDNVVRGIITGDMGITRDGKTGPAYQPGVELRSRYLLLAEGARGSLSQQAISLFELGKDRSPQKYGLGFKEIWEVDPAAHEEGLVQHTLGWPLDNRTGGGSYLYHLADNRVAVGLVVHLDYSNPHLSPFDEFQRFKTHPLIARTLRGGTRLQYGARSLTEGGWQSVPKLAFPGGALIGCAAGFMNVPRIKGSHNAILSAIFVADHAARALEADRSNDVLEGLDEAWRLGPIGADLRPVRNVKPLLSRLGTALGTLAAGAEMWLNVLARGWSPLGTLKHSKPDHTTLDSASKSPLIEYPKPDGVLSFDRNSSVFLSGTRHDEDQPVHLRLRDPNLQLRSELAEFDGPSQRFCPAGVFEWRETETGPCFQINAQNCIHCKTCDIKDPNQNIQWTPPQGGEGPAYSGM